MVFKRGKGRTYVFQGRTPTGYKQIQTGAPFTAVGKALALRMASMWESLANEHRAWDLLEWVMIAPGKTARRLRLGRLYDLWQSTRQNPTEVRRLFHDVDLEPYVARWHQTHRRGVSAGYAEHILQQVRFLLPEGQPCPLSRVTTAWLTDRLAAYKGGPAIVRHVHSAWSSLFGYLTMVHGLFSANPMAHVQRPALRKKPVQFYEMAEVLKIVEAQPTPERRALFALLYGTGIETGTVTKPLRRSDVHPASREIRAAGTKAHTRDRMAVVADWAWPIVWSYAKTLLPGAPLFPTAREPYQISHWHRWTVLEQAKLSRRLKVHAARHHWAVMRLRAGVPVAVVQHQLGHSTPVLTLTTYGPFIPTGEDRAHWEREVTKAEKRRGKQGA